MARDFFFLNREGPKDLKIIPFTQRYTAGDPAQSSFLVPRTKPLVVGRGEPAVLEQMILRSTNLAWRK
jgi:hypothetical protein